MSISKDKLKLLTGLIDAGKEHSFYLWTEWRHLSRYVRDVTDHGECQICKAEGKSGAKHRVLIVHHVKHLKDRPDLALSIYDPDTGERQLVTLCKRHHEVMHPETLRQNNQVGKSASYEEYWD